ncbi:uncharacterized protein [Halyomorpha halys]|uniref:uncharacterized protein n=1 Tax=Halyomorpha halys TaxID=286706 RepID=UPI0006D5153F
MYCSYLFFVVGIFAVQSVQSVSFHDLISECKKNLAYDGDVHKLNYNDPAYPEKAKCVMACALEQKGVFKEDGSIDRVKEKAIPEEIIKDEEIKIKFFEAIDECDVSAKANKCETAHEFLKCIHNKV